MSLAVVMVTLALVQAPQGPVLEKVMQVTDVRLELSAPFIGPKSEGHRELVAVTFRSRYPAPLLPRGAPGRHLMLGDFACRVVTEGLLLRGEGICLAPKPPSSKTVLWLAATDWSPARADAREIAEARAQTQTAGEWLAVELPQRPTAVMTAPDVLGAIRQLSTERPLGH